MSDIVERLRRCGCKTNGCELIKYEAADLIERLREEFVMLNRMNDTQAKTIERQAAEHAEDVHSNLKLQAEIERQAAEIEKYSQMAFTYGAKNQGLEDEIGRLREALRSIESNEYASFGGMRGIARAALNEHQEQPSDDPAKS